MARRGGLSCRLLITLVALVLLLAETTFLGRFSSSLVKVANEVEQNINFFVRPDTVSSSRKILPFDPAPLGCEKLLEDQDRIHYSRDFQKDPVRVEFSESQGTDGCAVPCVFNTNMPPNKNPDAVFGMRMDEGIARVARTMESKLYYAEYDVATAHSRGYSVVMTTSLSSDVPVGYFSWAEYDIMAPLQPKTEKALAAAFISNCGGHNFRLEAVTALQKLGISVDSYGSCLRNVHRAVDKVKALQHYKFSLAFENSNEEDYVTEKFWQSLVAGAVPVVIGAPNIAEFAPASNAIIHLKQIEDVQRVADYMKYLASNISAYNETLRWKFDGPSNSFKALVDMAAVHSSCRLCIHVATQIYAREEEALKDNKSKDRLCKCTQGDKTIFHLYVRERGRFYPESVFISSDNVTVRSLEKAIISKFTSKGHVPVWSRERPTILQGDGKLKIHTIYPVGLTQRQALYSWKFNDKSLGEYIKDNPCAKLEVIFV